MFVQLFEEPHANYEKTSAVAESRFPSRNNAKSNLVRLIRKTSPDKRPVPRHLTVDLFSAAPWSLQMRGSEPIASAAVSHSRKDPAVHFRNCIKGCVS
jgi:hypothetical protein